MKTVGITGGSGFIGGYVVEELERRGYQTLSFDHADHQTGKPIFLGDIRDPVPVTEFAAHVDGIIHLAGVLGTQETIANPIPAAHTNILGGLNMLQAASQYNLPAVVIGVGNHWMLNPYSVTKTTVEKFCSIYRKERGLAVSVVRALNAYGPRQAAVPPYGSSKVRKVMPSFVCKALSGDPIEIYGDGSQVMDFIFVADVARVLVQALEVTERVGGLDTVLEAGSGRRTTINEVASLVMEQAAKTTGRKININHLDMRPGEEPASVVMGDPATLKVIDMDGSDFVPLELGVTATVEYFANYLSSR